MLFLIIFIIVIVGEILEIELIHEYLQTLVLFYKKSLAWPSTREQNRTCRVLVVISAPSCGSRKNGDAQKSAVRSSQEARSCALVYHPCIRSDTKRVKF